VIALPPPDPGSLARLHDIVEPAPVSAWPLAPGAQALVALALVWMAAGCFLWWRRRRANAYRRVAVRELARLRPSLREPSTRGGALLELAVLLKRVALAAYPREQVASLTGDAWIRFLDGTVRGSPFAGRPGELLARIPSAPEAVVAEAGEDEMKALERSAARWIRHHRRGRA